MSIADITHVRVTGAGHLAIDLPDTLTQQLLERPKTQAHVSTAVRRSRRPT